MNLEVAELMSDQVFRSYCFWVAVLTLKICFMFPLTAKSRLQKKVLPSPEDTIFIKDAKILYNDPDVERVRRAHRNDLENILLFAAVGYYFILTKPEPKLAITLFRVIGFGRIIHTIVYAVFVLPQPARFLAWFAPYLSIFYMSIRIVINFI